MKRLLVAALLVVGLLDTAMAGAVAPGQVRVSWSDDAGALALSISSAIGAPSLGQIRRNPGAVAQSGGSILARAIAAKALILAQVEHLTGSQLSGVDVRISGVLTHDARRLA